MRFQAPYSHHHQLTAGQFGGGDGVQFSRIPARGLALMNNAPELNTCAQHFPFLHLEILIILLSRVSVMIDVDDRRERESKKKNKIRDKWETHVFSVLLLLKRVSSLRFNRKRIHRRPCAQYKYTKRWEKGGKAWRFMGASETKGKKKPRGMMTVI